MLKHMPPINMPHPTTIIEPHLERSLEGCNVQNANAKADVIPQNTAHPEMESVRMLPPVTSKKVPKIAMITATLTVMLGKRLERMAK